MIFFYYRHRITGWGAERSQTNPDFAREKFIHTPAHQLTPSQALLSLPALEVLFPNHP